MAVVDKTPGVTRDRNYAECSWAGKDFFLVDTGGFIPKTKDQLEKKVLAQVETAIYEADLVLFLVDNKVGIQIIEQDIAKRLRKVGKKIILVANKVDNQKEEQEIFGFKRLGLGDPIAVSAASGRNTGELLDKISDFLPEVKIEEEEIEIEEFPQLVKAGSVFWGIVLLALGVILLLANFDVIDYGTLFDFWPVLVIVIGLKFIIDYATKKNGKAES